MRIIKENIDINECIIGYVLPKDMSHNGNETIEAFKLAVKELKI